MKKRTGYHLKSAFGPKRRQMVDEGHREKLAKRAASFTKRPMFGIPEREKSAAELIFGRGF